MSRILLEVVPQPGFAGDLGAADRWEDFQARVGEFGDGVLAIVDALKSQLAERLRVPADGSVALSEMSTEFAVDFTAEAGVVISRASTTASFKVALKWTITKGGT